MAAVQLALQFSHQWPAGLPGDGRVGRQSQGLGPQQVALATGLHTQVAPDPMAAYLFPRGNLAPEALAGCHLLGRGVLAGSPSGRWQRKSATMARTTLITRLRNGEGRRAVVSAREAI